MLTTDFLPVHVEPQAQLALRNSAISELRELCAAKRERSLVISGVVSSYYHKQVAQERVWAVCRDLEMDLVNEVEVRSARRAGVSPYETD